MQLPTYNLARSMFESNDLGTQLFARVRSCTQQVSLEYRMFFDHATARKARAFYLSVFAFFRCLEVSVACLWLEPIALAQGCLLHALHAQEPAPALHDTLVGYSDEHTAP